MTAITLSLDMPIALSDVTGLPEQLAALKNTVSVKDFGAMGDGVADDTAALQAAIDYVASLPRRASIYLPCGKYKTTATLTIAADNIAVIGHGTPSIGPGDDSGGTSRGAVIRYYGAGTAVQVGIAPAVNGTHIFGTHLENLRIEVDNDAARGLHVWHSNTGFFKSISIFGNKGAGKRGLHVQAGVSNIYEMVSVNGLGQTLGSGPAEYLGEGLCADLGWLNELATTTVFRRCYFNYCNVAANIFYIFEFEDCVFEASAVGVLSAADCTGSFTRCWWEANTQNCSFSRAQRLDFFGGRMNSYAGQYLFGYADRVEAINFHGVSFISSHATPTMFEAGPLTTSPKGRIQFFGCSYPANVGMGGNPREVTSGYRNIANRDMQLVVYRFTALAVTGTGTHSMLADGGAASYVMPIAGHVVGLNVLSSGPLTGGTFDIATFKNLVAIADLSNPDIPALTANLVIERPFYLNKIEAGDSLSAYFHTSALTSTTDFTFEIVVALGADGTP